jgi:Kef-type K+ transport system membrane component KefB
MNTRGLMELVILNIGLSLEIISPALFSMMVVMTLVTTFMTTPILELIRPSRTLRSSHAAPAGEYAYSDRY